MFSQPLPIPEGAIPLQPNEKATIRKYLDRIEAAQRQVDVARESLNDICMAIAARDGHTETAFKLSADLGCLIPSKE